VISDIGLRLTSELPISDWGRGVRHYIRYRNKVLSDIRYLTSHFTQAQCYSARSPIQGAWVRICRMNYFFSSMSDIRLRSDVDIRTLPISEWRFSVRHICLRYRNNRCRCRMSDIADIEIDVDAHLWLPGSIDSTPVPTTWFPRSPLFTLVTGHIDVFHILGIGPIATVILACHNKLFAVFMRSMCLVDYYIRNLLVRGSSYSKVQFLFYLLRFRLLVQVPLTC
jgi:hypothetical protein